MTDSDALRELLERATALEGEVKAVGVLGDELAGVEGDVVADVDAAAGASVEELSAKIAELEDAMFALSHSSEPGADAEADAEAADFDLLDDPDADADASAVAADAGDELDFEDDTFDLDDEGDDEGMDFIEPDDAPADGGQIKAGFGPCPKCGSTDADEYADGTARCADCGTPLVEAKAGEPGEPPFEDFIAGLLEQKADEPADDDADDEFAIDAIEAELDAELAGKDLGDLEVKDTVRTPEGARRYGQPIGSVIVTDSQLATIGRLADRSHLTASGFHMARMEDANVNRAHAAIGRLPDGHPLKQAYTAWLKTLERKDGSTHDPSAQARAGSALKAAATKYQERGASANNEPKSVLDDKARAAITALGTPPEDPHRRAEWNAKRRAIIADAKKRSSLGGKIRGLFGKADDEPLEVKAVEAPGETLTEMELLLARRAQLDA